MVFLKDVFEKVNLYLKKKITDDKKACNYPTCKELKGMDTPSGEQLSQVFWLPSKKESTLKGKNLLPLGANFSLLG